MKAKKASLPDGFIENSILGSFIFEQKRKDDIAARRVHRESNLMFTLSSYTNSLSLFQRQKNLVSTKLCLDQAKANAKEKNV